MKARFYIDGIEVNEPLNYQGLEIELNYDTNTEKTITLSELEFGVSDGRNPNDAFKILQAKMLNGLNSGLGVTEGVSLKIQLDSERGEIDTLFSGYIDLWEAKYNRSKITAPIQVAGGIDWLNDRAHSITFDYLYDIGLITDDNFTVIPYCISKKQNSIEILLIITSLALISDRIAEQIVMIATTQGYLIPTTTFAAIAELIIRAAYVLILIASVVGLLVQLYNLWVQPVKYHNGMSVLDQFTIGLSYFGLKFSSSIFQNTPYGEMVLLPEKYALQVNVGLFANIQGILKPQKNAQKGYFNGTFGDFITSFKNMFNAKIVISEGVFYFEPANFRLGNGGFQIPNLWNSQYEFELNKSDFVSNYLLSFAIDTDDRNTIQEYVGTSIQAIQTQTAVGNKQMLLGKGLEEIRLSFALGKRKGSPSFIETLLVTTTRTIQQAVNALISAINQVVDVANFTIKSFNKIVKILKDLGINLNIPTIPQMNKLPFKEVAIKTSDRTGMLAMESDYVAVPKLLMLSGSGRTAKLQQNGLLSASFIFQTFHKYKLFVASGSTPSNQFFIRKADKVPFSYADYKKMLKNNACLDSEGNAGEIISLRFNPFGQTADITYKIRKEYTRNISLKYIEPDGK